MELRQLKHFLAVVDGESLGDAARKLEMSQPALSKSIQALELSVGVPLFTRSRRGMILNQSGRALMARARNMTIEAERATAEIREIEGAQRGRIVIGTSPSMANAILPEAIRRFRAQHARVEIEVAEDYPARLGPRVDAGEFDFAFGSLTPGFTGDGLEQEVLAERERIFIVTSNENPLASRDYVSPKELWPGPWLMSPDPYFRARLSEIFLHHDLPPPQAAISFSTVVFAKRFLQDGNYLLMLAESQVLEDVRRGAFSIVNAPDLAWERSIGMMYRRPLGSAAQILLAEVRHAFLVHHQAIRDGLGGKRS
jgi:DNA-binding transcriptional LysR family regulator